jgi:lipopolysaccharide export system permease protein
VPFVLFGGLILWMYWRVAYVPGGQPIGALERVAGNLGKWARQVAKRFNRDQIEAR